jgi:hypothetical protein
MSRVLREPIFIGRGPSDSGEGTTQYISNPRKCGPRDSTCGGGGTNGYFGVSTLDISV